VIRIDGGASGRIRVIGSLEGPSVDVLAEELERGATELDLSEVDKAEESAVRFLARLSPERCALVSCPAWLARWVERVRQEAGARP
jgi:hypothetical protein